MSISSRFATTRAFAPSRQLRPSLEQEEREEREFLPLLVEKHSRTCFPCFVLHEKRILSFLSFLLFGPRVAHDNKMRDMYDVIIVGAGPAGLSAGLVLGRCRRSVLICDTGRPRNAASTALDGYLTRQGNSPP